MKEVLIGFIMQIDNISDSTLNSKNEERSFKSLSLNRMGIEDVSSFKDKLMDLKITYETALNDSPMGKPEDFDIDIDNAINDKMKAQKKFASLEKKYSKKMGKLNNKLGILKKRKIKNEEKMKNDLEKLSSLKKTMSEKQPSKKNLNQMSKVIENLNKYNSKEESLFKKEGAVLEEINSEFLKLSAFKNSFQELDLKISDLRGIREEVAQRELNISTRLDDLEKQLNDPEWDNLVATSPLSKKHFEKKEEVISSFDCMDTSEISEEEREALDKLKIRFSEFMNVNEEAAKMETCSEDRFVFVMTEKENKILSKLSIDLFGDSPI